MILDKAALAVWRAAGKDPQARVLIEAQGAQGCRVVATNGQLLAVIEADAQGTLFEGEGEFPDTEGAQEPEARMVVPSALIEQVERSLPKTKGPTPGRVKLRIRRTTTKKAAQVEAGIGEATVVTDEAIFVGPDGQAAGRATIQGKAAKDSFPDYAKLTERNAELMGGKKPIRVALDFAHIANAAKIATACGGTVEGVTILIFEIWGPDQAVGIRSLLGSRMKAVIAPCSLGEEPPDKPKAESTAIPDAAKLEADRRGEDPVEKIVDEVARRVNEGELDSHGITATATVRGKTPGGERKPIVCKRCGARSGAPCRKPSGEKTLPHKERTAE